jgi:uncharacterized membrane protein YkoI
MKLMTILCAGLACVLLTACQSEKSERQASQARLMAEAKIGKADAERTALAQAPDGTVKESELEREKGKLIWSFDIATPGTKDITEVNVDAITGQVVSVEKETTKQQREEKEKDDKD